MRTAVNRVKKAQQHLDAARTVLGSIKPENISLFQDRMRILARKEIEECGWRLKDLLNSE